MNASVHASTPMWSHGNAGHFQELVSRRTTDMVLTHWRAKTWNSINHASLDRPRHKLPVAGQSGWSPQFDELPKLIAEVELAKGVAALGEFYRGHSWDTVAATARRLLGASVLDLPLQQVPVARCREHDGFELALWDALAKSHGLRLCDLLGGPVREQVKVSAWTGHRLTDLAEWPRRSRSGKAIACFRKWTGC